MQRVWTKQYVHDISVAVYRERLGEKDTASMIAKDNDSGEKMRARAMAYNNLTRIYLEVLARPEFKQCRS